MTASISAAYGLRGLPGPTGRFVHRGVAWGAHCEPPLVAHGTLSTMRSYFYPSERLSLERRKYDAVGKVQSVLPGILAHASISGNIGRAMHPRSFAGGFLAYLL